MHLAPLTAALNAMLAGLPFPIAQELDAGAVHHQMIGDLVRERDSARAEAEAEITRLTQILRTLQRTQFGRRSERLDPDQLQLGLEDLAADLAEAEAASVRTANEQGKAARQPEQRLSLPDHLPREDRILEVQTDTCPCCGGALHLIGETVSEMLDRIPARLRVIRIRRPRYGCRSCGTIQHAPAPERPIAKGLATLALLSHVLISKILRSPAALSPVADLRPAGRYAEPVDTGELGGGYGAVADPDPGPDCRPRDGSGAGLCR
jgi:hypothetical protein